MSAYVTRMDGPVDSDDKRTSHPSWETVREAIGQLDGKRKTLLVVGADDQDAHMAIGGGPEYFICYFTHDNLRFNNLNTHPPPCVQYIPLVAGGQKSEYDARLCVSLSTAVKAAQYYFCHGAGDPSLQWSKA